MSDQYGTRGILQYYGGDTTKDQFYRVYNARHEPGEIEKWGNQPLANAEHYAFARSLVEEMPWMLPSILAATPAYYLAKKMGILPTDDFTSDASLEQMGAGILGGWHGLTR